MWHGHLGARWRVCRSTRRTRFQQLGLTGFAIPDQDRDRDPSGRTVQSISTLSLCSCSLGLVSMVLEPNFHLGWCESDDGCQVFAFRSTQIPLLPETPFQLVRLSLGEEHTSFPLLMFGFFFMRLGWPTFQLVCWVDWTVVVGRRAIIVVSALQVFVLLSFLVIFVIFVII